MIEGVDYAWSRPDIGQLAAAGKRFACRYGGPGSDGKQLDPTEAAALIAAGVAIVANAEGSKDGLLGGWSAGVDWASRADARFRACGMPAGRPIYLSVDFDVTSAQWPAVADALRGAASVIGAARVGVYGGRRAIEWARRDGVAAWFWQTYAWSGGVWVPGNHIEQYLNGVPLAGATLDLDRARVGDFGQWPIGDDVSWSEQIDLPEEFFPELQGQASETAGAALAWTTARVRRQEVQMAELIAKVAALSVPQPTPVDVAALVAALRPELDAAAERAVRKVLGGLDGATPAS